MSSDPKYNELIDKINNLKLQDDIKTKIISCLKDSFVDNKEKVLLGKLELVKQIREDPGCIDKADFKNFDDAQAFSDDNKLRDYILDDNGRYYSLPGQRIILDPLIKVMDPEYQYNEYLYDNSLNIAGATIEFSNIVKEAKLSIIDKKRNEIKVKIDFTKYPKYNDWVIVDSFDLEVYLKNIIDKNDKLKSNKITKNIIVYIEEFKADRIIFKNLNLSILLGGMIKKIIFLKGLELKNCVVYSSSSSSFVSSPDDSDFENKALYIRGLEFDCSSIGCEVIDLRNTRFFCGLEIRNIDMSNTRNSQKVSLEDARLDGDLSIANCNFGSVKLYCLQTVMGRFVSELDDKGSTKNTKRDERKINLKNNVFAEDSEIHMFDIEMLGGEIIFEEMPVIPKTNIVPHYIKEKCNPQSVVNSEKYCPEITLKILKGCITNNLQIGNVKYLVTDEVTNNGNIIEYNSWADINPKEKYGRISWRSLIAIDSKLLRAVYNYGRKKEKNNEQSALEQNEKTNEGIIKRVKGKVKKIKEKKEEKVKKMAKIAKSLNLLKKNFEANGRYDNEDVAWILFMEKRLYIDKNVRLKSKNILRRAYLALREVILKFIYISLLIFGKYGISIRRVTLSIFLTVMFSWGLYFVIGNSCEGQTIHMDGYENLAFELKTFIFSVNQIIPFASSYEASGLWMIIISIIERFLGLFLIGYFSIAVVRRTLK